MGRLARIFGAVSREEMNGIQLNMRLPFWELSGKTDFPSIFLALPDLLPEDCTLYFEGGSPTGKLLDFLRQLRIAERTHVAYGTIWPRPAVFHIAASLDNMMRLAELASSCAYPELAIHFHVYSGETILFQWHDVFAQPLLLSGALAEEKVRKFAERLGMSLRPGVLIQ